MQDFLTGGVCFAEKQLIVSPYFQILAFIILVQLTIQDEHLSLIIHVGKIINHPSILIIIFHLLLYVAEVLSSLIDHERWPIRIEFLILQGKPNTHTWGATSPTQHFPFLPGSWIRVTPSTTEYDYSTPACCAHPGLRPKGGEGKDHSPVQSSTLLTDYHISRHVASTFKRLTNVPHTAALVPFH